MEPLDKGNGDPGGRQLGSGIAVGAATGMIFGAAFGAVAIGLVVGAALGLAGALGACPSNGVRPRGGVFGVSRVGETTSRSSVTARRKDDAWTTEPPSAQRVTAAGGRLQRCPASDHRPAGGGAQLKAMPSASRLTTLRAVPSGTLARRAPREAWSRLAPLLQQPSRPCAIHRDLPPGWRRPERNLQTELFYKSAPNGARDVG